MSKRKPDITTPNTLIVGLYVQDGKAVALGTIRTMRVEPVTVQGENLVQLLHDDIAQPDDCNVRPDVLQACGHKWEALAIALGEVAVIDVDNIVILTNDAGVTEALTALTVPEAAESQEVTLYWDNVAKRNVKTTVRTVWNPYHTAVLQILGMRGGHWRITQVEDLPKAREVWQSRNA